MNRSRSLISQLYSLRNQYGNEIRKPSDPRRSDGFRISLKKLELLNAINRGIEKDLPGKKALQTWYDTLLFLLAYPDNKSIYQLAFQSLQQLQSIIQSHSRLKDSLYNSGITNTQLCAAYSFEMVKWLRQDHAKDIRLISFEANDGMIRSILSVAMPEVESEILQDGNASWKPWLEGSMKKGEELLDRFLAVFDQTGIRPEVRDELWGAIGINTEIDFPTHDCLPDSLCTLYYHRSLIKKDYKQQHSEKPIRVRVNETEAKQIIDCSRMILVRHLREIDPITFTAPRLVAYYQLERGLSIALMGMVPERRHPIDCYTGYAVFKNGLPIGYAGSWILFDSGRIGFNIFPSYRGGESQYIFQQILNVHRRVYRLKRFTVDPYQIGKDNSDGIHSGAFWIYYHAGFRPLRKELRELAAAETIKIKANHKYRTPSSVLKKLADSRSELVMQMNAVRFDATDLSRVYASIVKEKFNNNRKQAEDRCLKKLIDWLKLKNYHEEKLMFILRNWAVLLFGKEEPPRSNKLKSVLKKLFALKVKGAEEEYMALMQASKELKIYMKELTVV